MSTPTFWVEPTGMVRLALRRWASPSSCPGPMGYHDAEVAVGRAPAAEDDRGYLVELRNDTSEEWPTSCDGCDYRFTEDDRRQVRQDRLYRQRETGAEWVLRHLPPGAMYDATWMPEAWRGTDGIALVVMLPTNPPHPWMVDGEASNCGRKGDRSHKCWVRHGAPRTDRITVDKNGETCTAGGGSIAVPGYHGFLHNGELT